MVKKNALDKALGKAMQRKQSFKTATAHVLPKDKAA